MHTLDTESIKPMVIDQDSQDLAARQQLRERGPSELRQALEHIQARLPEIEQQAEEARKVVKRDVLGVLRSSHPDVEDAELRKDAKFCAGSGTASEWLQEALSELETSDRVGDRGMHGHVARLLRERRRLLKTRGRMKARRSALRKALDEWSTGQLEADEQRPDPVAEIEREATTVFGGKERPKGSRRGIPQDVKKWAQDAFNRLIEENDTPNEQAKDMVLRIAREHNYHFTRRSLETWIS